MKMATSDGATPVRSFDGVLTKHNKKVVDILFQTCLSEELRSSFTDEFYGEWSETKNRSVNRLLYHADTTVGGLVARAEKDGAATALRIDAVAVLPNYRRFGFAEKLLKLTLEGASEAGTFTSAYAVVPTANEAACNLFEKSGFKADSTDGGNARYTIAVAAKAETSKGG